MPSILIQNGQLVTEQGVNRASILIEDNIITSIYEPKTNNHKLTTAPGVEILDATDLLIFPGLIDCHVHLREPGNSEAEDMESGTTAAIAGGITTVCDMPNTNPPTCTRKALEDKIERAKRIEGHDIRFFFGVTKMDHLKELESIDPNDICGVKLYFDQSTGNQKAAASVIDETFRLCKKMDLTVVCHCEDATINAEVKKLVRQDIVEAHSLNRPVASEVKAIGDAIKLSKKYGTNLHIAHLSTSAGLDLVKKAKADGVNITCEVAPHHLFLSTNDYKTLGTLGKMNPPLRTPDNCRALMEGVIDGSVDCIASDHAPHTLESKMYAPDDAPSGVPGTETMLTLLLSCLNEGPKDSNGNSRKPSAQLTPEDILRLLFTNPNQIFNLGKPGITPDKPADLTLVNPCQSWEIHGKDLHSKCGWTPYEEWHMQGKTARVLS